MNSKLITLAAVLLASPARAQSWLPQPCSMLGTSSALQYQVKLVLVGMVIGGLKEAGPRPAGTSKDGVQTMLGKVLSTATVTPRSTS